MDVERWNNWDYPSHWQHEESFPTLEEALEYIDKTKNDKNDYRIITVVWENNS